MRVRPTPLGSYLSGNGPLVDVLRYAIASDLRVRLGVSAAEAKRRASVFIQPVHRFIGELHEKSAPPPEHVIVFDEAQRAWNAEHMLREKDVKGSEPEVALSIMQRAPEWSVIVALVGEGQEINRGEAGLAPWIDALGAHPAWRIVAAPRVHALLASSLRERSTQASELHLSVGVRAPRAQAIADWADALLTGQFAAAAAIAAQATGFPLHLTRDLHEMKAYLADRARPDRRVGLVASAQARRLRAFGIEMDSAFQGSINWPRWFVDGPNDIRSSYTLEVAASEFKCQGLELDWVGLCWDGDMRWEHRSWASYRLVGARWNRDSDRTHAINRYRVLLTRARFGTVIWVPNPSDDVPLMDRERFDEVAARLRAAGVEPLA